MKISQMRRRANIGQSAPLSQKRKELNASLRADGYVPEAIYQEMEMDSVYVNTHDDESFQEDVVKLHSHIFYELLYCRSGSLQYLLGTERYRMQRGDVVFIPPGVSHRPLFLDKLVEPYTRYVIWISPLFAEELIRAFPGEEILPDQPFLLRTAGSAWDEELRGLFSAGVQECYASLPGWQAAVCGNTTRLLVQLMRARCRDRALTPPAEKMELMDQIVLYIESHLREKITLSDTARIFLVSESSISQLFRRRMKVSFYHFVTQRRLIGAKSLLLEEIPAEQVCARMGFGDYSTFYRAFKREYGISPAQFRQLQE